MPNYSSFPDTIDVFQKKYSLLASDVQKMKRHQDLSAKDNRTPSENDEMGVLQQALAYAFIDPEEWNKFQDALVNMENFIQNNVTGYLTQKQNEFNATLNKFAYQGVYDPAKQYYKWNVVIYNSEAYLCISDNVGFAPTNATYWSLISPKGPKGDPGLGLSYKGDYSSSTNYNIGDAVTYGGLLYYAKVATTNIVPTDTNNWILYEKVIVSNTAPTSPQYGLIWIDTSS